jgi:hypothetical protein
LQEKVTLKVIKKDETVQKRVKFVNTSLTRKVEERKHDLRDRFEKTYTERKIV